MNKSLKSLQYSLIICRYNEIGLKSPKVRSRMETRLIKHIHKICKRENLLIIKSERNWGRIIFEFNPIDIPKALEIFKYIIGLHSFSPALKILSDFDILANISIEFADTIIEDGETFAVRSRRIKSFQKTSQEIDKIIGAKIIDTYQKTKNISVKLKNPDKIIYIEVRDDGIYLFSNIFYTIWGGNPIEIDKAMLSLCEGKFGELSANQLMIRRGTIIIPILFTQNDNQIFNQQIQLTDIKEKLEKIAKFFAEPLSIIQLDLTPLLKNQYYKGLNIESNDILKVKLYYFFIEKLRDIINLNKEIIYAKKSIEIKGLITSTLITNKSRYQMGQKLTMAHFMPLIGLLEHNIQKLENKIEEKNTTEDMSDFSLANLIVVDYNNRNHELLCNKTNDNRNINHFENNQLFDTVFDNEDFLDIVEEILKNRKLIKLSGKILT